MMDGWIDMMDGWIDMTEGWMDGWTDTQVDKQIPWVDRQMGGWMDPTNWFPAEPWQI